MTTLPLTFDHPLWLLALPALAFFVLAARRSRAALPIRAARLALAVRLCVAALLLLSLAGPRVVRRTDRQTVLFLLDVSQSIRPDQRAASIAYVRQALAHMGRGDQGGVIVFGQTPSLDVPPSPAPSLDALHASVAANATDLAAALRLAEGAFPSGRGRRIVVLSDGCETRGDAAAESDTLRLAGVRVDIAPSDLDLDSPSATAAPEALVAAVQAPDEAQASAPIPVRVQMESTVAQSAVLTVSRDGRVLSRQTVALAAGRTGISITDRPPLPGLHHYEAALLPQRDGLAQNNHAFADVLVHGRPHVLYITDTPALAALPAILRAQGMEVTLAAPGSVPASVGALTAYDSVVLSGVPADEFTPAQQDALRLAASDFGVGLGMIGGPNSFGAGRWAGSPVETALPVTMEVPRNRRLPPAAVVVALDASGSMAATEDGVEKVQLGARAAVQLMSSLQPADEVAVTAVTTVSDVVVPLQPVSHIAQARTAIEGVHAGGGGIYCRQALEDSYALLLSSHAAIKHVILVADTNDSEQPEDCAAMAGFMRRKYHITTTVCGIGLSTDHDCPFQRAVARAGGGQWFAVSEASGLPPLFRRDVQTIQQSWYVESPSLSHSDPGDPVLSGLSFAAAPPLLGHNLVTAKPGAQTGVRAVSGDPLFVHGQAGLARTFACTADDLPHWAAGWLRWPGGPRFYAQAVRYGLRGANRAPFAASLTAQAGRARLLVDTASPAIPATALTATVVAPDMSTQTVPVSRSGAGRYDAQFDADQPGTYLVSVRQAGVGGGAKALRLAVPYAPEYRTLGANLPLLTQLADATGGHWQPDPARVFADRAAVLLGDTPVASALLLLAAALFVLDVAVRRLALSLPAVRAALSQAPSRARLVAARAQSLVGSPPPPVAPAQADALLSRRVAARAPSEMPVPRPDPPASRDTFADDNPFPQVAALRPRPAPRDRD